MKDEIILLLKRKPTQLTDVLIESLVNVENSQVEINRWFRKLLCSSGVETITCRKYLEDDLPYQEWITQIQTFVIPFLYKNLSVGDIHE